jgi:hypothetical protein
MVNIQFLVDVVMIGDCWRRKDCFKTASIATLNSLHWQKMYLQKVAPMVTIQATPGKNFKELAPA